MSLPMVSLETCASTRTRTRSSDRDPRAFLDSINDSREAVGNGESLTKPVVSPRQYDWGAKIKVVLLHHRRTFWNNSVT